MKRVPVKDVKLMTKTTDSWFVNTNAYTLEPNRIGWLEGELEKTFERGEFLITLQGQWAQNGADRNSFSYSPDVDEPVKIECLATNADGVTLQPVEVVNERGDVLDPASALASMDFLDVTAADIGDLLNDRLWAAEFESFTLEVTDAPDVVLRGEKLASVCNQPDPSHSDFSGMEGQYESYQVYQTTQGTIVAHKRLRTVYIGAVDHGEVRQYKTLEEITDLFGYSDLAKALYSVLELDTSVEIL